ncbi:MAG TPA: DUF4401 domain-containing protein [Chitinolyticbacter sp.]|nr:DUF4401 domain-containing protein [Chitinolyticbacter sp.]
MSWNELIADLRGRGELAESAVLPMPAMHWGIQLLQGIAAWVAAILVLAAILVPVAISGAESLQVLLGIVFLVGAAVALRRATPQFIKSAAVPFALAGAALIPIGLRLEQHIDVTLFVIGIGLFLLSPYRLLRFLAAALAFGVIWYWLLPERWFSYYGELEQLRYWGTYLAVARHLLFSWLIWALWTCRVRWPAVQWPLRDAALVIWLAGLVVLVDQHLEAPMFGLTAVRDWLPAIVQQAVLLWAVFSAVRRQPQVFALVWPLALLLPLAVLSPQLSAGLLLLWLGLSTHRLLLLWLGLTTLLFGYGAWYYSLALPLWHKGLILIGMGGVLLAGWGWLQRRTA